MLTLAADTYLSGAFKAPPNLFGGIIMIYVILALLTALVASNRYALYREKVIVNRRLRALTARKLAQADIDNPEVNAWPI